MTICLSLLALVAVVSALVMMRGRHSLVVDVALGVHELSLVLMLTALSRPLVALMGAALGVGVILVRVLSRRERAHAVALQAALWPLAREGGLLCLVLLFWWLLRRPTFVEEMIEMAPGTGTMGKEVLILLYTRYAGAMLGVGLMLLVAVMGIAGQRRDG
ncbi:MAG: hypothetical protein ACQEQT_00715 [Chloroflexota bacterium]